MSSCCIKLISFWTVVTVCVSPAQAWNPTGHKTITSIIFRRLPAERRFELAELLHAHPRYAEDFFAVMPADVRDGDLEMQAEWLLQQASVWPDIVRSGPPERTAYNRPPWHYLPRAFYLTNVPVEFRQKTAVSFNSRLDPESGTDNQQLNGPQAFKVNFRILNDPSASKAQRAVALCWVLHIGQDLHQPCHTASLCMPGLFPEGDRGANDIKTEPLHNLHAVWDGPLGSDDWYRQCRNLAIAMIGNASPEALNPVVLSLDEEVDKWLAEGLSLEAEAVYVDEVREAVTSGKPLGRVQLSVDYLANVRRVAETRLVLAGARLSAILQWQ